MRSCRKHKVRDTTEAIIGVVTGLFAVPQTVLLGRYDAEGRLRYTGATFLPQAAIPQGRLTH
jgi:hypothetical protein